MKQSQVILGIDPGYDRVGWAVGEGYGSQVKVLAYGCVQTSKRQSAAERYAKIDQELTQVITTFNPTTAGLEALFFTKNQTSGLQVAEARGVIISLLFRHHIQYQDYTPPQVKLSVTGNGRADKTAVKKMIGLLLPTIPQDVRPQLDDTLDAVAIMLTHAASLTTTQLNQTGRGQ